MIMTTMVTPTTPSRPPRPPRALLHLAVSVSSVKRLVAHIDVECLADREGFCFRDCRHPFGRGSALCMI